ncbi:hypothetical protein CASFOL_016746 [Castilleja foliolosa]|uniref:Peptidase A1 domain-containing protein n=1 Tax=Castilleja foliolosa TaxID=1961234 RepID=A0ABD3DC89_9LAMI
MHQEMYMKALTLYLLTWITNFGVRTGSPIFFPIEGNVYPLGYYTVTIYVGNPPKSYVLDVDTGSDLTWIRNAWVSRDDPDCESLEKRRRNGDICDYEVEYGDPPYLTIGCGDSNEDEHSIHQPITQGILGLGKGKLGILNQLRNKGVINRNVVGHCLSRRDGGYIFFGEIPFFGITWKQISCINDEHYSLGSADILLDGQATDIRNLCIIFDSGSTFTYLNSESYEALFDLVNKTINGTLSVANDDEALPFCWQDVEPIQTIAQVARAFLSITLNFTDENNVVQFEMLPESYLLVSDLRNVCLGILNGGEIGLGDVNVIGDISMQDKLVIYDNENHMVGWAASTCKYKR